MRATLVIVICLLASASAKAESNTDRLSAALSSMHVWVGNDDNGMRWRTYLKSTELQSQIALGHSADRRAVARILEIYGGEAAGLDRPRFADVRAAIRDWHAQLPVSIDELAQFAEEGQDDFQPVSDSEVTSRAQRLQLAVEQLGRYLDGSDSENTARWKKFLKWEALVSEPMAGERPDVLGLRSALSAFQGRHDGLELRTFTNVRAQLREYLNAALFRFQPPSNELFAGRVTDLAVRLRSFNETRQADDAQVIGRTVGWLDSGGQLPAVVAGVRQHYWHSNLYAQVSAKLISAGVGSQVDQVQDVNEVILGTSIYGQARTTGQITLRTVPAQHQACFDLEMTGVARSNNVGYNGPVTVYTSGVTNIFARKRVYMDEFGLTADPAAASCNTYSNINSIAARSKIVRKIAWRRAGKTKSQAEGIASRRAERRVAGQIDGQAAASLQDANKQFKERLLKPLTQLDAFPRHVALRTDESHLRADVLHATPFQLAAPADPPQAQPDADLALQVHESLVANFSESLIGGRTVTDEQLAKLLTDAGADLPEELKTGPDTDPWSISFAPIQPVRANFDGGLATVAIHGRRFTRGEQEIRSDIEISATYRLEKVGNGIRMTRDGDVQVEYVNQTRLSVAQVAMKTFLRRKFEALFEPEIVSEGLVLPGEWEKAGLLRLIDLASDNDWLSLGWRAYDDSIRTANAN